MSNFRTHNLVGGIDGLYIKLYDTTINSTYVTNDVDILTGITGGELTITDVVTDATYNTTLSIEQVLESRSSAGCLIPTSDFTPSIVNSISSGGGFDDSLYSTEYTINAVKISNPLTPTTSTSTMSVLFYGIIDIKIKRSIINTAWKVVYSGKSLYYDNALKLKSWFDNMKTANELGFNSEALRLLNALKKVVV